MTRRPAYWDDELELMQAEGIDFIEAVERLAKERGMLSRERRWGPRKDCPPELDAALAWLVNSAARRFSAASKWKHSLVDLSRRHGIGRNWGNNG